MIIGFGNRRKVANAINFVFVTAVVAAAGINEVQQTPSHKMEYRHVTPAGAAPPSTYVKRVYLKSGEFLDYRYVTPTEDVIVPGAGLGSGGDYRGRVLPSLDQYEKRIKELLEKEKAELLKEKKKAKKRIIRLEAEKLLVGQQEENRQEQETELKYLLVSDSLLKIEKELVEINEKCAKINLLARIMRDDEEVLMIIYG